MLSLLDRPLIFIDTETTGLDASKHEIIELAIIRVEPNGQEYTYQWYIRPERLEDAEAKALEINKYHERKALWDEKGVSFRDIADQVADIVREGVFAGHNVSFDVDFLNQAYKRAGMQVRLPYHKVDTVTLAYTHLVPLGLKRLSLDTVREFMGWSKENAHSALQDAKDAKKLFNMTTKNRMWCYWIWFKNLWRR